MLKKSKLFDSYWFILRNMTKIISDIIYHSLCIGLKGITYVNKKIFPVMNLLIDDHDIPFPGLHFLNYGSRAWLNSSQRTT